MHLSNVALTVVSQGEAQCVARGVALEWAVMGLAVRTAVRCQHVSLSRLCIRESTYVMAFLAGNTAWHSEHWRKFGAAEPVPC